MCWHSFLLLLKVTLEFQWLAILFLIYSTAAAGVLLPFSGKEYSCKGSSIFSGTSFSNKIIAQLTGKISNFNDSVRHDYIYMYAYFSILLCYFYIFCGFRWAYGCCAHPKAHQNTLWGRFQPFLFILDVVLWFFI